jgi:hypothetical protein
VFGSGIGFVSHGAIGGSGPGARSRGPGAGGWIGSTSTAGKTGRCTVSGNGIGFVWHARSLQQEQVLHGALIHAVEAGFVAVEQGEAMGIGGILKGGSQEAGSVTGFRDVEAVVQQLGFDGPGAAHAPPGGDHFFDDAELDAVGWLEAPQVVGQDLRETGGRFVFQEYDAGE